MHMNKRIWRAVVLAALILVGLSGSSVADSTLAVSAPTEGTISFYLVHEGWKMKLVKAVPAGKGPTEMCLSPDQSQLYVSVPPEKKVVVIDVKSQAVTGTLSDPAMSSPDGCTVSPDSKKIYSVDQKANTVFVFSAASGQLLNKIAVGEEPRRALFSPDGRKLIVSNEGGNTLSVIDPTSNEVIKTIKTGKGPRWLSYSPDRKTLAVSVLDDDSVGFFTADSLEFEQQVSSQVVSPQRLDFSPDGRLLFVLGRFEQIAVLNLRDETYPENRRLATTIPIPRLAWGMVTSPDGGFLYITQSGADYNISVIDVRLMKTIVNMPGPTGVRDIVYIK